MLYLIRTDSVSFIANSCTQNLYSLTHLINGFPQTGLQIFLFLQMFLNKVSYSQGSLSNHQSITVSFLSLLQVTVGWLLVIFSKLLTRTLNRILCCPSETPDCLQVCSSYLSIYFNANCLYPKAKRKKTQLL